MDKLLFELILLFLCQPFCLSQNVTYENVIEIPASVFDLLVKNKNEFQKNYYTLPVVVTPVFEDSSFVREKRTKKPDKVLLTPLYFSYNQKQDGANYEEEGPEGHKPGQVEDQPASQTVANHQIKPERRKYIHHKDNQRHHHEVKTERNIQEKDPQYDYYDLYVDHNKDLHFVPIPNTEAPKNEPPQSYSKFIDVDITSEKPIVAKYDYFTDHSTVKTQQQPLKIETTRSRPSVQKKSKQKSKNSKPNQEEPPQKLKQDKIVEKPKKIGENRKSQKVQKSPEEPKSQKEKAPSKNYELKTKKKYQVSTVKRKQIKTTKKLPETNFSLKRSKSLPDSSTERNYDMKRTKSLEDSSETNVNFKRAKDLEDSRQETKINLKRAKDLKDANPVLESPEKLEDEEHDDSAPSQVKFSVRKNPQEENKRRHFETTYQPIIYLDDFVPEESTATTVAYRRHKNPRKEDTKKEARRPIENKGSREEERRAPIEEEPPIEKADITPEFVKKQKIPVANFHFTLKDTPRPPPEHHNDDSSENFRKIVENGDGSSENFRKTNVQNDNNSSESENGDPGSSSEDRKNGNEDTKPEKYRDPEKEYNEHVLPKNYYLDRRPEKKKVSPSGMKLVPKKFVDYDIFEEIFPNRYKNEQHKDEENGPKRKFIKEKAFPELDETGEDERGTKNERNEDYRSERKPRKEKAFPELDEKDEDERGTGRVAHDERNKEKSFRREETERGRRVLADKEFTTTGDPRKYEVTELLEYDSPSNLEALPNRRAGSSKNVENSESSEDTPPSSSEDVAPASSDNAPKTQAHLQKDSVPSEQKHAPAHKNSHHKQGGGKDHHSDHHGEKGEKSDSGHKGEHKHYKKEAGHHDKKDHKGGYKDKGGHEKKSHNDKGYFGEHKEGSEGEKASEFKESGEHKKGHSTKGEHNVHKKEEYSKTKHFFDESHEEGEHEKHGGHHEEHSKKKGGKEKYGHLNSGYKDHHYGKKGKHAKGKSYHEDKGHKDGGGHKKHYNHHDKYAKKDDHDEHKKWVYKKKG